MNHFGSPFNFPEEFVTVYRLHPLLPDLLEFRDLSVDPNVVHGKLPVIAIFRGRASTATAEPAWVNDNGPDGPMMESGEVNGHVQPVSPVKRVLLRNIPELARELEGVRSAFDPWARDRGQHYSLEWTPRPGAEND